MHSAAKNPILTGARGFCPRCGEGKLFRSFLRLAPRCGVCGLDYGFADPGAGPAFFALTVMSFPAVDLRSGLIAPIGRPGGFIWLRACRF